MNEAQCSRGVLCSVLVNADESNLRANQLHRKSVNVNVHMHWPTEWCLAANHDCFGKALEGESACCVNALLWCCGVKVHTKPPTNHHTGYIRDQTLSASLQPRFHPALNRMRANVSNTAKRKCELRSRFRVRANQTHITSKHHVGK